MARIPFLNAAKTASVNVHIQKETVTAMADECAAVPAFLRYLTQNDIPDAEFIRSYGETRPGDYPLWWKCDVPVNLTASEKKKEMKKQSAINRYLAESLTRQRKLNEQYAANLRYEEEAFKKKVADLKAHIDLKIRETEMSAAENAENLAKELLQREAALREAERERKTAEAFLQNEQAYLKNQADVQKKLDDIQDKIALVNEAVALEALKKEEAQRKYAEVRQSTGRGNADYPLYKEAGIIVPAVVNKKYEEFDASNIAELRDIYFKRKSSAEYLLKGVTVAVKRGLATVVYSSERDKLSYIRQILNRSYGSDLHVIQGVVRLDGKEAGQIPRDEYKNEFGNLMVFYTALADMLNRSRSQVKNIFKGEAEEVKFKAYCDLFGLPQKIMTMRPTKIDDAEINKLSLAATLAMNRELAVIETPEDFLDKERQDVLCRYLGKGRLPKAVLMLTTSLELVSAIADAKVYKI